jgi:hypothetical protein
MFSGIIVIGLLGAYLVSYFDKEGKAEVIDPNSQVAK